MAKARKTLTWGGRLIGTIPHAAARHGLTNNAMHKALRVHNGRDDVPEILPVLDDEDEPVVSAREPVYYLAEIDAMMGGRRGKGANLRKDARTK